MKTRSVRQVRVALMARPSLDGPLKGPKGFRAAASIC